MPKASPHAPQAKENARFYEQTFFSQILRTKRADAYGMTPLTNIGVANPSHQ
jgi:hypothetical protein